ncbi:MAG: hypothetical protein B7Z73_11945, partial [Planctomycetia bacterium 21-64-5]
MSGRRPAAHLPAQHVPAGPRHVLPQLGRRPISRTDRSRRAACRGRERPGGRGERFRGHGQAEPVRCQRSGRQLLLRKSHAGPRRAAAVRRTRTALRTRLRRRG